MKVGTLIKHVNAPNGCIGIVVEGYDIPKKLWRVHWFTKSGVHEGEGDVSLLVHERYMKAIG